MCVHNAAFIFVTFSQESQGKFKIRVSDHNLYYLLCSVALETRSDLIQLFEIVSFVFEFTDALKKSMNEVHSVFEPLDFGN